MNRPVLTVMLGCLLSAVPAAAQISPEAWMKPSAEQINAIYPEIESLYFDLHRTRELAMHE